MKKISVVIPCYNEEENVCGMYSAVKNVIEKELSEYDYEILFIDNKSRDKTRELLKDISAKDKKVKVIFNLKNFGQFNSPYYGLLQATGDCMLRVSADFQDPVEMIPKMVRKWEEGVKVICMIKKTSRENRIMRLLRTLYYKILKNMSDGVTQIEHYTGFGLYDRSFIEVVRQLNDQTPFFRSIVAEYAPDHFEMEYEQQKRKAGKTHNNFHTLYDAAMLSFTSYTKAGLRVATFCGFFIAMISFFIGIGFLIAKLVAWNRFSAGYAPIIISLFFMGGIILTFLGFMGEYIMSMNSRIINRPLVIEEERINFDN